MKKQSLNGIWLYRVGKGEFTEKVVPYSCLAVGKSECRKDFDLEYKGEIVLLRFDRITYHAVVTLNGVVLGEMGPYCEYTFDVTNVVKATGNALRVEISDLIAPFGPTAGWENYGGICGEVSILYAGRSYIENVCFESKLSADYKSATYSVTAMVGGEKDCEIFVALSKDGVVVDEYALLGNESRTVNSVALWSPDSPELYDLKVTLSKGGLVLDEKCERVGFREFSCSRHRFILNGEELFLVGVCRHEMVEEFGHCVPESKIRSEMEKIKASGCNFVRLVHYPHAKITLSIADELGLMVSEEPGLWWSDTTNPDIANGSLEVLKRTVRRDRNHPSIVFWLCFNECRFTAKYLRDAASVCRANDKTRLVSGANCMGFDDTLKHYNECGFDFYTMHPYAPDFGFSRESAERLYDKPLMFTEWGGYFLYDNPHLLTDFIKGFYDLYLNNDDSGALAGCSFWYWSEVNDFTRGKPACVDGALREALFDRNGNPSIIYPAFVKAWAEVRSPEPYERSFKIDIVDDRDLGTPLACNSESDFSAFLRADDLSVYPQFHERERMRKTVVGPALYGELYGINSVPLVASEGKSVEFLGNVSGKTVSVIGLTSAPKGYPVAGEYGEEGGSLVITSATGKTVVVSLQNGVHFTTCHTTLASSRIIPVAEKATPYARFSYEKNFENYIINRLDIALPEDFGAVESVSVSSSGKGYNLLVYGVFVR